MKKSKKLLSILLVFCLIAAMIPLGVFTASAESATSGTTGACTWTLNGTELTISGNGEMGKYTYYGALPWGRNITKVTIENGVTSIGSDAFYNCSRLTSITIPNSVTRIGGSAFYNCSSLTSITIPNSVTSIGVFAFQDTAWYNNQPNGPIYAGKVFYNYKGARPSSVTIKAGTVGIADDVFCECTSLTSITIPNSVTSIGGQAFLGCSSLERVNITDIGAWCKIKFSDSRSNPLNKAEQLFLNGKRVNELVIPQNVTAINAYAFENLTTLKSVKIPKTVTSIETDAFSECIRLDNVYYGGNEADWNKIKIGTGNKYLESAEITYNCYSSVTDLDGKEGVNDSDDGTSSNVNTLDGPKPNASTSDDTDTDADDDNGENKTNSKKKDSSDNGENKTNSKKKGSSDNGDEIQVLEGESFKMPAWGWIAIGVFALLIIGIIAVGIVVLCGSNKKKKKKKVKVEKEPKTVAKAPVDETPTDTQE